MAALVCCAVYLAGDARARRCRTASMLLAVLAGVGNGAGLIGFYKAAELGPLSHGRADRRHGRDRAGGLRASPPATRSGATQVAGVVLAMAGAALAARAEPPGDGGAGALPRPARRA